MRLDKYLKVSRIIKRRTVANDACDAAHVTVNGRPAKASYDVKVGDILICPTVSGLNYGKVVRVDVPREEIDPRWRDSLREIVDFAPEG